MLTSDSSGLLVGFQPSSLLSLDSVVTQYNILPLRPSFPSPWHSLIIINIGLTQLFVFCRSAPRLHKQLYGLILSVVLFSVSLEYSVWLDNLSMHPTNFSYIIPHNRYSNFRFFLRLAPELTTVANLLLFFLLFLPKSPQYLVVSF